MAENGDIYSGKISETTDLVCFLKLCYTGCCWEYPCGGVCEGISGADCWWKGGLLPTVWWYSAFIHGKESPEFAHNQRIWFYSSS